MANTKQNLPSSEYPNQVTSYVSQWTEAVAGGFLTLKSNTKKFLSRRPLSNASESRERAGSIPPALKHK